MKDLALITWWALRLYAKRVYYTFYYGFGYSRMLQIEYTINAKERWTK